MPGEVWMKWIIQESIQLVAKQPGIGRPERVAGTRELVVSGLPYIIPYFEQDGSVITLRIMPSKKERKAMIALGHAWISSQNTRDDQEFFLCCRFPHIMAPCC